MLGLEICNHLFLRSVRVSSSDQSDEWIRVNDSQIRTSEENIQGKRNGSGYKRKSTVHLRFAGIRTAQPQWIASDREKCDGKGPPNAVETLLPLRSDR